MAENEDDDLQWLPAPARLTARSCGLEEDTTPGNSDDDCGPDELFADESEAFWAQDVKLFLPCGEKTLDIDQSDVIRLWRMMGAQVVCDKLMCTHLVLDYVHSGPGPGDTDCSALERWAQGNQVECVSTWWLYMCAIENTLLDSRWATFRPLRCKEGIPRMLELHVCLHQDSFSSHFDLLQTSFAIERTGVRFHDDHVGECSIIVGAPGVQPVFVGEEDGKKRYRWADGCEWTASLGYVDMTWVMDCLETWSLMPMPKTDTEEAASKGRGKGFCEERQDIQAGREDVSTGIKRSGGLKSDGEREERGGKTVEESDAAQTLDTRGQEPLEILESVASLGDEKLEAGVAEDQTRALEEGEVRETQNGVEVEGCVGGMSALPHACMLPMPLCGSSNADKAEERTVEARAILERIKAEREMRERERREREREEEEERWRRERAKERERERDRIKRAQDQARKDMDVGVVQEEEVGGTLGSRENRVEEEWAMVEEEGPGGEDAVSARETRTATGQDTQRRRRSQIDGMEEDGEGSSGGCGTGLTCKARNKEQKWDRNKEHEKERLGVDKHARGGGGHARDSRHEPAEELPSDDDAPLIHSIWSTSAGCTRASTSLPSGARLPDPHCSLLPTLIHTSKDHGEGGEAEGGIFGDDDDDMSLGERRKRFERLQRKVQNGDGFVPTIEDLLVWQNPPPLGGAGRVKARFMRGRVWYAGKIVAVHSEGRADVSYDDGDFEARVRPKHIRLLLGEQAGTGEGKDRKGKKKRTKKKKEGMGKGRKPDKKPRPAAPGHLRGFDEEEFTRIVKPKTSSNGAWNTGWHLWEHCMIEDEEEDGGVGGGGGTGPRGNGTESLTVPIVPNAKWVSQIQKLSSNALDPAEKGILKVSGKDGMGVNLSRLQELCEALTNNCAICKLDLDNTHIGDAGLVTLCDMLRVNTRAQKLDLQGCDISDEGFKHLADALIARDIRMKELYMSRNHITDQSLQHILRLCSRFPSLKFYSGNTKILENARTTTEEAIEEMIKNQIKQRKAEEAAAAADEEGWGGDEEEESDADDDDVQLIDPGVGRSEISHRSRARDDVEEGEEEEESQMPARRGNKARESRAARMAQLLDESSSSDQDQSGGGIEDQRRRLKRQRCSSSSSAHSASSCSSASSDSEDVFKPASCAGKKSTPSVPTEEGPM